MAHLTTTNVLSSLAAIVGVLLKIREGSTGVFSDAASFLILILVAIAIIDWVSDGKIDGVIAGWCRRR